MRLLLLAVGQKMPAWVGTAFAEYAGRLPPHLRLELVEKPVSPWADRGDVARAMREEAAALNAAIPESAQRIALDERGKSWTTRDLAAQLAGWQQDGRDVALLVGGPDGLDPTLKASASQRWSLSPLTLPHPLVRVLVAEQLYRAWSILANHPYHRD